jgi:hypothetical protein
VTLWVGDPNANDPADTASYPDTEFNDGQSWDVELTAFSEVGNENNAVQTIILGGDNGDVPNIGSPGNGLAVPPSFGLTISEIFPGQSGDELTADWFEIKNIIPGDWDATVDPPLFYDDESASAADADSIFGIDFIGPFETAIVLITGDTADITQFREVWGEVINLEGISIGWTDGAGLGGGGDAVTLWVGDPNSFIPIATGSYPNTDLNDGQSYDVELGAFSTVGNANGATQTLALGGDAGDVPNIGSPGNQGLVGITELQALKAIAYPNPTHNILTIELEEPKEDLILEIVDQLGRTIQIDELSNNGIVIQLDLSDIPAGMYVLRLNSADTFSSLSIVKR